MDRITKGTVWDAMRHACRRVAQTQVTHRVWAYRRRLHVLPNTPAAMRGALPQLGILVGEAVVQSTLHIRGHSYAVPGWSWWRRGRFVPDFLS